MDRATAKYKSDAIEWVRMTTKFGSVRFQRYRIHSNVIRPPWELVHGEMRDAGRWNGNVPSPWCKARFVCCAATSNGDKKSAATARAAKVLIVLKETKRVMIVMMLYARIMLSRCRMRSMYTYFCFSSVLLRGTKMVWVDFLCLLLTNFLFYYMFTEIQPEHIEKLPKWIVFGNSKQTW